MKKSIPKVRERESEASILGNDREREFLLTPAREANHQTRSDKNDKSPKKVFAPLFHSRQPTTMASCDVNTVGSDTSC